MEGQEKEVYFNTYCGLCSYNVLSEDEFPCDECLKNPSNIDSNKPVYFKKENDV